ncbi:hypothetical protein B0H11DRAFT_843958 [Mycena galericulata]|nr:hypothetical protein B0H11DRAFT_843958 [Mycena galericulata]
MLKSAEMQKLAAEVDELQPEREPWIFSANVTTKLDTPSLTATDKLDVMAILTAPPHLSPEQYTQKLESLVDRFLALPSVHTAFLKFTIWHQNGNINPHIQAWGLSAPSPTFVIIAESKKPGLLTEVLADPAVHQLLAEAKRDLELQAEGNMYFCADVVTRLDRS